MSGVEVAIVSAVWLVALATLVRAARKDRLLNKTYCRTCIEGGVETVHRAPSYRLARWLSIRHERRVHGASVYDRGVR